MNTPTSTAVQQAANQLLLKDVGAEPPPAAIDWSLVGKAAAVLVGVGALFWAAMALLPAPARRRVNPVSTKVQSLLFSRANGWTVEKANAWAQDHGYRHRDADVTKNFIRLRQMDPGKFGKMRTITFGRGIKAVVGR